MTDPPTRIVPPTGQTDNLEGPTCAQSGDPRCNDLETCKDSCKRTIKGGKGQLKQTELRTYLAQLKWTTTRAVVLTAATDKLQWSQVTKIPRHNAA